LRSKYTLEIEFLCVLSYMSHFPLQLLLQKMLENEGSGQLNLVGHSMGGLVVGLAMRELRIKTAQRQPWSLRTVVATAPVTKAGYWAESVETMHRDLLEHQRPLVRSVRYMSSCDIAVSLFDTILGSPRLDGITIEPLSDLVKTVDVSEAVFLNRSDPFIHSYHNWAPEVLFDLHHVLKGTGKEKDFRQVKVGESGREYFALGSK
jgi:esterase/lipase superfamily enzyme